jgi:hypothetical protein
MAVGGDRGAKNLGEVKETGGLAKMVAGSR